MNHQDQATTAHRDGHYRRVIRSYEPGEDWTRCHLYQFAFEFQGASSTPSQP